MRKEASVCVGELFLQLKPVFLHYTSTLKDSVMSLVTWLNMNWWTYPRNSHVSVDYKISIKKSGNVSHPDQNNCLYIYSVKTQQCLFAMCWIEQQECNILKMVILFWKHILKSFLATLSTIIMGNVAVWNAVPVWTIVHGIFPLIKISRQSSLITHQIHDKII